MSYLNRNSTRRSAISAELLYLVIVLAAGGSTFWYAGNKLGMDLSTVTTAASILGIGHAPLRYDPRARVQSATAQVAPAAEAPAPTAPYCSPGQTPAFANGLAQLKLELGEVMGTALECEHPSSVVGDTVQQTSTGLAAYSKTTNTVTFTDGWRHWAIRDGSVLSWEGTQAEPPSPQG
jgi:hypothetical protein